MGWVRQRQFPDQFDHRLRFRLRVRLVDRRQVFQILEALRLEPSFRFIETGPVPPLAPGLGDVAKFLRQFQNTQAALRQLRVSVPLLRPRRRR